jgi:hypothetical protein
MNTKKIVIIEIIKQIETEEAWFDAVYKVHPDFNQEDYDNGLMDFRTEYINRGDGYWYEGDDTPISELERVLSELKTANATHFSVMHHEDHGNFVFTGTKVYPANSVETQKALDDINMKKKAEIELRLKHINEAKRIAEKELASL